MSAASNPPTGATSAPDNSRRRGMLLTLASVFVLGGLIWLALWYFVFSLRVTTNDAYVHGNQVNVAAAVPGTIVAVLADDTQMVRAGQPLLKLDPTDAELNLASARHALQQAVRGVAAQFAQSAQAEAEVAAREAQLTQAEDTLRRSAPLLHERAVSAEQVTQLRNAVAAARAALRAAEQRVAAARAGVQGADIARNPAVLRARDAFRAAWINLQRHVVLAPVSGYLAQRTAQLGQRIRPGQPLMQVIPLSHLWVDANFKETQLAAMRIGQPATLTSDLYGSGVVFHGKVVGLGAGTGSVFALLPPQNASGNWIKVVQRLPVRISIDSADLVKHPLRLGLSMNVDVDIRDHHGQVLAQQPADQPAAVTTVYAQELAGADVAAARIIASTEAAATTAAHGKRRS
ncbi:HlyD family efflux transporter periplasmic adaptor subunit [Metallibacterium sp.]|uniref:HlyD family efflux transporter periplasmic adaptor subunit n=1 Tax=Metallibacterium sp. TaxID=2940281 RepID=UPI00260B5865|nr:HlyD family efflux transporter periplasmic adaptor subunit [Metallibacterium sp.]